MTTATDQSDDMPRRAKRQGLRYVEAAALRFTRRKSGRGFLYLNAGGRVIRGEPALARIRGLVIPPAWTEVCIATDARAHLQAIGRDEAGRLQYIYHSDWVEVRDHVKAERLVRFGKALPRIRARVEKDLRRRKADRRYAAAAATRLVDKALIRSGHTGTEDGGRGATTLLRSDVKLNGTKVHLDFTGKGGKTIRKTVHDPVLLERLRKLRRIGRSRLFVFRDVANKRHSLSARDLNEYLREAAGKPVTAKDFRTFAASSLALAELAKAEPAESVSARKRVVAAVMRSASDALVNTPAVARASYVHPLVVAAYEEGRLRPDMLSGAPRNGLDRAESALMRFLEGEAG